MMAKQLFLIFTILTFVSCSNTDENIHKTKSGEFASKTGNFIAKFPTKPSYSTIDNQVGLDKFQIHLFRSTLGANKIFSIEYVDYPDYMIKSMTDDQIYSQGVINFSNKMSETFELEFQKPIEQHGLKGLYFVLNIKQVLLDKGVKGHIQGKIFRKENRVYTIAYLGEDDKNIDPFMTSFRLIK